MKNNFIDIVKNCEYCGKEFHRKKFRKNYENVDLFIKRKYCSRDCMKKAFLRVGINCSDSSTTHATARNINRLILKKDKCEVCGNDVNGLLVIHHKDHNENNNELSNLMCLCRSCHAKTHRPRKNCKVYGCDDKATGKGYCQKHYQRFRKYGSPFIVFNKIVDSEGDTK